MSEKIRNFIIENMINSEEDELKDSDNIFEMGYVNSLFAMKLVTFVESEFNIELTNEDINVANFSSVNNIKSLIQRKQ